MKKWMLAVVAILILVGCVPATAVPIPEPTATRLILPVTTNTFVPTATPIIITPTISPTPTATPIPAITMGASYLIQPGDTLSAISDRSGVPVWYLARVNGITDISLIYAGTYLTIPTWPSPIGTSENPDKWILVVLSEQRVYAVENNIIVKTFIVSTGVAEHPTVTGTFHINEKLESTRMTGPGYDLPNVPWTMYFYRGYSFHGTYWHHNFGTPMSHGCVNMKTEDAEWLFFWAPMGTLVSVTE